MKFLLPGVTTAVVVASPVLTSLVVYSVCGWLRRSPVAPEIDELLNALNQDGPAKDRQIKPAYQNEATRRAE
ncbi:hypothetical protein VRC02_06420 [Erwinia sp. E_sp_B01_3]|uniref:hypothetical protein n=1 Tax=Erwinia sp. E_sp_B01_3 TaxID=3039402 RepID=UPI0030CD15BC